MSTRYISEINIFDTFWKHIYNQSDLEKEYLLYSKSFHKKLSKQNKKTGVWVNRQPKRKMIKGWLKEQLHMANKHNKRCSNWTCKLKQLEGIFL